MILSHTRRYIFIKTKKVAGTSIQLTLAEDDLVHLGGQDVITGPPVHDTLKCEVTPEMEQWGIAPKHHLAASWLKNTLGPDIWENYFSFTVERNPWDFWVSMFHFWRNRHHSEVEGWTRSGFAGFLQYFILKTDHHNFRHYTDARMSGWVSFKDPEILVDKVVLYEDLDAGMQEVYKTIAPGTKWEGLKARVHTGIRPKKKPPAEHYNKVSDRLIRQTYSWVIERFGYEGPSEE